jgi:hypothetical protein
MPATSKRRRAGPGGQTTASARSSRASSARPQQGMEAAGIDELEVAEVEHERPTAGADRSVERAFHARHRGDDDLAAHGDTSHLLRPDVNRLDRCGRADAKAIAELQQGASVGRARERGEETAKRSRGGQIG